MEVEENNLTSIMEEDDTNSNSANVPVPVPILNTAAEEDGEDDPESERADQDELKCTNETETDVEPNVSGITEAEPDFEDSVIQGDDDNDNTTNAELMENLPELEELNTEEAEDVKIDTELTEPIAGIRIDENQIISMEEAETAENVPPEYAEEDIKIEAPEPEVPTGPLIPTVETAPPVTIKKDDDLDIILDEDISRDPPSEQDQSAATESKNLESGNTSNIDETSMDSVSVCSEITPGLKRSAKSREKGSSEVSVSPTRPPSTRNKFSRDKALFDEMKFMADFDPTSSNRNREKKRKRYTDGRQQLIADHYDDCDCLLKNCPGCHYPCKRCGDSRCGHECRQGRRWLYESIEVEGRGIELRNPHINN